jgi:hypothetical protein
MQGDRIRDRDHISRYCPFTKISETTRKPSGAAFQLRPNETYISVNWLEHFSSLSRDEQIEEIRKVLALKMKGIGATAKLAIYNAGEIVQKFSSPADSVRVLHEPLLNPVADPSHAGIFDFDSSRDEQLLTLLLSQIDCDMADARSS